MAPSLRTPVLAGLLALGAAACSSWRPVETYPRWTLFAEDPARIDAPAFERAYEPAFAAVEAALGPFRAPVRVHAFDDEVESSAGGVGEIHEVPGIGRARVRAFHTRSDGPFGPRAGIYAGTPDPGTAVHELVHARVAEIDPHMPLWFEEGLACVLGDGFLDGDRWVVDGLACWPLRELRARPPDEREVARLLSVRADGGVDLAENVLVHFLGWAVVFDLYREAGAFTWQAWLARARTMSAHEARERLQRTLARETEIAWLARLDDPDPGVRMATAKGLWKLRSELVLPALLERLGAEEEPEVRVALAINALATAGEEAPPGRLAGRMWRAVWPALRRAELPDPAENAAVEELLRSFRWRGAGRSGDALDALRRFWSE